MTKRKRNHGASRRRKWKQSHYASAVIFFGLGMAFILLTGGALGGFILAASCFVLAALDIRAAKRGWRMIGEPPPRAYRHAKQDGFAGEFARRYIANWERTKHLKRKPRYAFDREKVQ